MVVNRVLSARNVAIASFVAALPLYINLRSPAPSKSDLSQSIAGQGKATVTGIIKTVPVETQFGWKTIMEVKQAKDQVASGDVVVYMPHRFQSYGIVPGKNVTFLADISKCKPKAGNSYCDYLKRQGIFAIVKAKKAIAISDGANFTYLIQQKIIKSQDNPLLTSMIIGDKAVTIPEEQMTQFKNSGLVRLLVVDGFKVTIILGFLAVLLAKADRRLRLVVGVAALVILVSIAGPYPGVVRAALLGATALFADSFTVRSRLKPAALVILLGAGMLVWNPQLMYDIGFQMTYLATIGIMTQTDRIARMFSFLPFIIRESTAVSVTAMLWTLPVQLTAFGTVNPYSLPANIIASPVVAPLTVGAAASAGMCFVPAIGQHLARGSAILLDPGVQFLVFLAQITNRLPMSHVEYQLNIGVELLIYLLLFGANILPAPRSIYSPPGRKQKV